MITKHYEINAPIGEVWKALVDPDAIEQWGGGPAVMDDKKGTEFSLWGGDIYGRNTEVVPVKKLVQDWYGGDWDKPSRATFKLSEEGGKTILELENTDVPMNEVARIDSGWDDYYLGPIKELLEH